MPGSKLPSESVLCERYNVSPMTVRRSIKTLLDEGIVSTIQGSGTYVKAPDLGRVTFSLEEFFSIFRDKTNTKVKILETSVIRVDEAAAEKLDIHPGERAILIRRVIQRDGDPILYHRELLIYDPCKPAVEAEMEMTSLEGLFVGKGESYLKRGVLTIEATVLTREEAEILNTMEMQPAFRLEHIFFDWEDKPLSLGHFMCRGDRFRFTASVGIENNATQ